jgi:hypothetical protein
MRKLKNVTASNIEHVLSGYVFEPDVIVEISTVDVDNMLDDQMRDFISNGDIVVINDDDEELAPVIGYSLFSSRSISIASSVAVDKNGVDQAITADTWEVVQAERIIWDLNGDYDEADDDFVVPENGLYKADPVLRIKDIEHVDVVELAIFKREDPVDDYWFILDRQYPSDQNLSEVILSNSVAFDFYKGEHYCLKVKITSSSGQTGVANIDGSDDYTAWGFDLSKKL